MSIFRAALATGSVALLASAAAAQTWPNKPITIVVGAVPGGSPDIVARILAEHLSAKLHAPVVVENKAGAGGIPAVMDVKNAPADGHRLLFAYTAIYSITPQLMKSVPYDPVKDFAPLGMVARVPQVLSVPTTLGVKNYAEFSSWLKANANRVSYGSSGVGTPMHVSGEMFSQGQHVKAVHIPYKGQTAAHTDLISGRLTYMFDALPGTLGHAKSGKLIPLAITGPMRSPLLPDVPTLTELNAKNADIEAWFGLSAAVATPAPVLQRLSMALKQVMDEPAVRTRFQEIGARPISTTASEMAALAAKDAELWRDLIKRTGVQPE